MNTAENKPAPTPDLTNLMEWNRFAEEKKTVIETLTILNNRHLKAIAEIERQRDAARELLREIRDNEVNAQDEADKFLRDHVCSELSNARADIAELNQRLIERQESFTAQVVRIEDTWREKLKEQGAQIVALRDALEFIPKSGSMLGHAAETKRLAALSTPPPAVVPLEDVRPLVEALMNCEHHIECSWRTAINCPPGKCDCGRDDALATFTAKYPL